MNIKTTTMLAGSLSLITAGTAQAALESRLSGQAYYDTVLGITWLVDASLAASNTFGVTGINANGTMNWNTADSWITAMNAAGGTGYLGSNDWRLPTMLNTGIKGCDFSVTGGTDCGYNVQTSSGSPPYPATTAYSEMASLFYDTLGNLAYYDTAGNPNQPGWGLTNTGPFSNLQSIDYWSGQEYAPSSDYAWTFGFYDGYQNLANKGNDGYAWAVQSGDVSAVPVPAAVWLFGSSIVGLVGLARRKR